MEVVFLYCYDDGQKLTAAWRIGPPCLSVYSLARQFTRSKAQVRKVSRDGVEILAVNPNGFMSHIVNDSMLREFELSKSLPSGPFYCYERCWFNRGHAFVLIRQSTASLVSPYCTEAQIARNARRAVLCTAWQCGLEVEFQRQPSSRAMPFSPFSTDETAATAEDVASSSEEPEDLEDLDEEDETSVSSSALPSVEATPGRTAEPRGSAITPKTSTIKTATTAGQTRRPRMVPALVFKKSFESIKSASLQVTQVPLATARGAFHRIPEIAAVLKARLYTPIFVRNQMADLRRSITFAVTEAFSL